MTAVEVEVLVAGEVPTPHTYVFRRPGEGRIGRIWGVLRGGAPLLSPLLAFVVRHPSEGTILVDTGLHRDAIDSLRGDYGPFLSQLFRKLEPAGQSFDEQLRARSVEPEAVELVVMTHLHVDHTGGMRLLPRAEFVCSRREWAAATGRRAALGGYVAHHLPEASRTRLVDLDRDGVPYGPFRQTVDLLGDGSIRLLSTPGHTPGHMSVLLTVGTGQEVLLAGDAAYTLRNIDEQILPAFTADDERALRSLRDLKAFADERPDVRVVPTHDPDAWRLLARSPQEAR